MQCSRTCLIMTKESFHSLHKKNVFHFFDITKEYSKNRSATKLLLHIFPQHDQIVPTTSSAIIMYVICDRILNKICLNKTKPKWRNFIRLRSHRWNLKICWRSLVYLYCEFCGFSAQNKTISNLLIKPIRLPIFSHNDSEAKMSNVWFNKNLETIFNRFLNCFSFPVPVWSSFVV